MSARRVGFEAIVVDDGSRDSLEALVAARDGQLELSLHRQPNRGPAAARNAGAELARGELLAFVDDDIALAPSWLVSMDRAASTHPGAALGGAVAPSPRGSRSAIVSQLIVDLATGRRREPGARPAVARSLRFLPTNNLAVPADCFAHLGGFDPGFRVSEDREFCRRWRQDGRLLLFVEDARCTHLKELGVPGFLRQHYRYGKGAFSYRRSAKAAGHPADPIEPEFYRRVLAEAVAALRRRDLGVVALLALWQLANAVGYGTAAIRSLLDRRPPRRRAIRTSPR